MNKKLIISVSVLVILIAAIGCFMYKPFAQPQPQPQPDPGRYMDIESFVRNSISFISPVKESLGGTFYVTKIETKDGTGVVEYEDGHNAYVADFTYTVSQDGKPTIVTFAVRDFFRDQ